MVRIDSLQFFLNFAEMQMRKGGVGQSVTPREILKLSKLPRTVVYHHLNSLIKRGLLRRVKRGYYCLVWCEPLVAVSVSTMNYWDMLEWNREREVFLSQFKPKSKRKGKKHHGQ